jgi:hypothetical protein
VYYGKKAVSGAQRVSKASRQISAVFNLPCTVPIHTRVHTHETGVFSLHKLTNALPIAASD